MEDHGRELNVPLTMKVFESGAKSTTEKPRYDLVPRIGVEFAANRFAYGAGRHGAKNYIKGKDDPKFIQDRINHLVEHVLKYAEDRQRTDLEAIICNGMMLAELGAWRGPSSVEGITK